MSGEGAEGVNPADAGAVLEALDDTGDNGSSDGSSHGEGGAGSGAHRRYVNCASMCVCGTLMALCNNVAGLPGREWRLALLPSIF